MVDMLADKLRQHPELGKHLFWLEGISDEYLEKVYTASSSLIAASEGEGFGLPLIEAAQHKLPIIARDIPVFREVAGEHAFYFRGQKPADLADAVQRWLSLNSEGLAPQSTRMPWLTWSESAQQLIARMNLGNAEKIGKANAAQVTQSNETELYQMT
jgi:glycosyltransferase involved in cell wall biosynthesis